MRIIVQKFGGTSLAEPAVRLAAVKKVIEAIHRGFSPVMVVSAMGRSPQPYATDTLLSLLREIAQDVDVDPRERDLIMACGEIISTAVMAQLLKVMGIKAIALTGAQAGIVTTSEYGNARILRIDTDYIMHLLKEGYVPVVAGFQGAAEPVPPQVHGDITTLGRGGSDTTASALGAALNAERVEIYTDVDGVMTADPQIVSNAKVLPRLSYEEVSEMAHQGARVVHPRAIEIAMEYGVDVWVKNTRSDHPGSQITSYEELPFEEKERITAITNLGSIAYLHIGVQEEDKPYVEVEIYKMLGRLRVNAYLASMSNDRITFAVTRQNLWKVRRLLDSVVVPVLRDGKPRLYLFDTGSDRISFLIQREELSKLGDSAEVEVIPVEIMENTSLVSVIFSHPSLLQKVMVRMLSVLNEEDIPFIQIADSRLSASALLNESDTARAVRALHKEFGL
ncbi:aspartate kinase [bacterium]|nr:aspartate kinase [bacterium]